MTRARYQQVSLDDTPYYHCISRCVRRAFLCGDDPVSGRNFDHRKRWLVIRIKQLAEQFAVDVCAYAVMSNHYHLVLFVNQHQAQDWTDDEVIARWTALFPRNAALVETLLNNQASAAARKLLKQKVSLWRQRLTDISWFMRCLNETIARRANREDECSGRFWEGRFRSQALLDEKALVTCMAYVDLNPVRAGLAQSLEGSDFTSIQERLIEQARRSRNRNTRQKRLLTRRSARHLTSARPAFRQARLKPLSELGESGSAALPVSIHAYQGLLEATCRALAGDADSDEGTALILQAQSELLSSINISPQSWLQGVTGFQRFYSLAAGGEAALVSFHASRIRSGVELSHRRKWIRGVRSARLLYGT